MYGGGRKPSTLAAGRAYCRPPLRSFPSAAMKKNLLPAYLLAAVLLLTSWASAAWAQTAPVTVSPAAFADTTPITLTFDATLGNAGLANYAGDVYIYTGVITNLSTSDTNWRYVVNNNFGSPVAAEKMTALGNHKYSISFTPRTYYPGLSSSGENGGASWPWCFGRRAARPRARARATPTSCCRCQPRLIRACRPGPSPMALPTSTTAPRPSSPSRRPTKTRWP